MRWPLFHVQALCAIEVYQSINVSTNGSQNLRLWVLLHIVYTSILSARNAFISINALRGSTSSPIKVVKI